jgi:hypothetical protein
MAAIKKEPAGLWDRAKPFGTVIATETYFDGSLLTLTGKWGR